VEVEGMLVVVEHVLSSEEQTFVAGKGLMVVDMRLNSRVGVVLREPVHQLVSLEAVIAGVDIHHQGEDVQTRRGCLGDKAHRIDVGSELR
jgi:hypothetical protein